MSELRKANTDHPYFVTLTVVGWLDIFTRKEYSNIVIESLEFCRENKGLKVYAYCIMHSHIHLILQHQEGKLAEVLRDMKSFTAKQIIKAIETNPVESRKEWLLYMFKFFAKRQQQNTHYQFWQKTSHPIELNYASIFDQKMDYIHNNPVEAGFVIEPDQWYYSSACLFSPLKVEVS